MSVVVTGNIRVLKWPATATAVLSATCVGDSVPDAVKLLKTGGCVPTATTPVAVGPQSPLQVSCVAVV